ncbi:uncharacterized protein TRIADDRAFT_55237 [Trichoplax adhaerens]|uniref:DUF4524 domain-containing protein n=1 Tax=Trichoplax adhaerens TaxID=10228 RepID=B3RUC7_TRIAD|nr:hypothetical protein TRIADDRAFT_55237 [Trichoplax adhaerens]EDV25787.1 hypothetical protein TRIADDRAFT_55237 [Trichoplax adhaerens]|eukprot:XP_002111820.1 hypothetical protein TRIADDRAFT_55237 [Trichoplax adhaerens]
MSYQDNHDINAKDDYPWQTIVYCNGMVEARFCDGLAMTLSKCGNYTTILNHSMPFSNNKAIKQMTRFATSRNQKKIHYMIKTRNLYTLYPCCGISNPEHKEIKNRYSPIAIWPKASGHPHVKRNSNGSVTVTALNNAATLILKNHQQSFTVKFIAKCIDSNGDEEYSEIVQQYSIRSALECWRHPMHLALDVIGSANRKEDTDNDEKTPDECASDNDDLLVHVPFPIFNRDSEPPTQNLTDNKLISIIIANNCHYRFFYDHLRVEVLLPNGAYLVSRGEFANYFDFYSYDTSLKQLQQLTYSTQYKLQLWNDLLSAQAELKRIIFQSLKFFFQIKRLPSTLRQKVTVSYTPDKYPDAKPTLKKSNSANALQRKTQPMKEDITITELGRFIAYSTGRIHIHFNDGIMLNGRYLLKENITSPQYELILPNGNVTLIPAETEAHYNYYSILASLSIWQPWSANITENLATVKDLNYVNTEKFQMECINDLIDNNLSKTSELLKAINDMQQN